MSLRFEILITREQPKSNCLSSCADHTVHHILTIYALGATPDEIRAAYDRDKSYQRPVLPTTQSVVESLHDKTQFQQHLGKEKNYPNYLAFFQQEIEKKGVPDVLNEYLFSGSESAETMLARLYGGEWTCSWSSCYSN